MKMSALLKNSKLKQYFLKDKNTPKLFIIESILPYLSGHFFNQLLGFKRAAEKNGIKPFVFLPIEAEIKFANIFDAERIIQSTQQNFTSIEYGLDTLFESDKKLHPLWDRIEAIQPSNQDIILILSDNPAFTYSLGAWISRLAPLQRPSVFIRVISACNYVNFEDMHYNNQGLIYKFVSRDLHLRSGTDRIFFMTNTKHALISLSRLFLRRFFYMPLPKIYDILGQSSSHTADDLLVYIHINSRVHSALHEIKSIIHTILNQYPNIRFLIKHTLDAFKNPIVRQLSCDFIHTQVEFLPSEQSYEEYMSSINRSSILVLPYDPVQYRLHNSGVFAEGAALGKIIVYPQSCVWMDDHIVAGNAVGLSFHMPTKLEITDALLQGINQFATLSVKAQERAKNFRKNNSCEENLNIMRHLSQQKKNMGLTYILESVINFRDKVDSRGYMGEGWGDTESGGVWTVSSLAQLMLYCEIEKPSSPLLLKILLTPFLSSNRTQTIILTINGVETVEWIFLDHQENYPTWHLLILPTKINLFPLNIHVHVKEPTSPQQIGLSQDSRLLGVMFHEMIINYDKI